MARTAIEIRMSDIWLSLKKLVKNEGIDKFHEITQFTASLLLKF